MALIYFTTTPATCSCTVENELEGAYDHARQLDGTPIHDMRCPVRCPHQTEVDRFGKPSVEERDRRNLKRWVRCIFDYDHEGDHYATSQLGGHPVWWSDEETQRHYKPKWFGDAEREAFP